MKLTAHRFSIQFLMLMAFSQTIGAQPRGSGKPCLSDELPFRITDGYLIQVEGAIGAQTHLKFILDTGASMSIVDSKIADALKLPRKPAESFNFDRKLAWEPATIPDLRFGPIRAIDTGMLVGPLAKYSEFARNVDAIVGLDLLGFEDFTVDYAAKKIVFHSSAKRLAQVRDDALSNGLTLQIKIQGHPVRLIVDTGFPGILLFEERLLARVPEFTMTREVLAVTLGDRLHAKKTTLQGVVIGPTSRAVSVLLTKAPPPEILSEIDGIAGIAVLNARRVHFNFVEQNFSWE